MKNRHVERLRLAAKRYHRQNRNTHFDNGIVIFHTYDGQEADRLSWWDDVTFILNDYRVAVAWVHPRMVYQDRIQDEAFEQAEHLRSGEISRNATPTYKKLGRSRKKIASWRTAPATDRIWFDAVDAAEHRLRQVADYRIAPYINVRWCNYSRLVSLCAPLDVRNEEDLRALVTLTRRILMGETSLQQVFPDYYYTREDWVREGLDGRDSGLHCHQLA